MSDVDVYVGNDTIIDQEVYELWLEGYSAKDAVLALQKRGAQCQTSATADIIMADTLDHYRLFSMLEKLLHNPTMFGEQLTYQISPNRQNLLIEKYYEFDDEVVREILGKKLSTKTRKDLDEVAEKTKVSLKSCQRQFDNVKRVYRQMEGVKGSLATLIGQNYHITVKLAEKYAAFVFIAYNRFDTSRRKLLYLNFNDFLECAKLMLKKWSCSASVIGCKPDETDADLDKEFLQDLKDLRVLLDKEHLEEHRGLVCRQVQRKLTAKTYGEVEANFKSLSRTIVGLGGGLCHSREARDFFVDAVEKLIEPCKQMHWTKDELDVFLSAYAEAAHGMTVFKSVYPHLLVSWERYITTLILCILRLYH